MKNVFESTNVKNEIPFNIRLRKLIKYAGYNTDSWGWSREVAQDMYNKELLDLKHEYRGKDAYEDGNDAIDRLLTSAANRIRQHTSEKYTHASMITGAWLYRYCQFFQCSAAYLFGEIPGFTPEETDIQSVTGLDSKAIRTLMNYRISGLIENDNTIGAVLSFLLRPDHCKRNAGGLLHLIAAYLTSADFTIGGFDEHFHADGKNGSGFELPTVDVVQASLPNMIIERLHEYRAEIKAKK